MKQIQFNDEEAQAWVNIMDAGVKSLGLSVAKASAIFLDRIQAAEEVKDEPEQK